jgi:hypothetical protein
MSSNKSATQHPTHSNNYSASNSNNKSVSDEPASDKNSQP